MYHSRVSKSSCFLAKVGSTTANGIQWNAVSHAAKNGYSHLDKTVRKSKAKTLSGLTCRAWRERLRHACVASPVANVSFEPLFTRHFAYLVSNILAFMGRWWLEWISAQPLLLDELVVLFRPKHSPQSLPHDLLQIISNCTHR